MAISVVQSAIATTNTSANPSASFAANVTNGNAVIVVLTSYDTPSLNLQTAPTDSKSNTYHQAAYLQGSGTAYSLGFWYAYNVTGGFMTVTETFAEYCCCGPNSVPGTIAIYEVSGLGTSSPLDAHSLLGFTGTGTQTSPSVTTGTANEILIGGVAAGTGSSETTSFTVGSGYSNFENLNSTLDPYVGTAAEAQIVSSAGSYTASFGITNSGGSGTTNGTIGICTFLATGGGGGTPSASVTGECWGGGAGGGGHANGTAGGAGGGGGGAYTKSSYTAVSGNAYTVTVGGAGGGGAASSNSDGGPGGSSWFLTTSIEANGGTAVGSGGNGGSAGVGGTVTGSPATGNAGGNGAAGLASGRSGAGGGGAAQGSVGGNASAATGGSGGTIGTGSSAGGAGANGIANGGNSAGNTGNFIGGGGSGGQRSSGGGNAGGAGAAGQVTISAPIGTITSAVGGTHSQSGGYDYWVFTASGTWSPTITSTTSHNGSTLMTMGMG